MRNVNGSEWAHVINLADAIADSSGHYIKMVRVSADTWMVHVEESGCPSLETGHGETPQIARRNLEEKLTQRARDERKRRQDIIASLNAVLGPNEPEQPSEEKSK